MGRVKRKFNIRDCCGEGWGEERGRGNQKKLEGTGAKSDKQKLGGGMGKDQPI